MHTGNKMTRKMAAEILVDQGGECMPEEGGFKLECSFHRCPCYRDKKCQAQDDNLHEFNRRAFDIATLFLEEVNGNEDDTKIGS